MTFFVNSKIVFDVTVVSVVVKHCKICLNCSDLNLAALGYSDIWFKSRKEMFLLYLYSSDKNYWKNCYLDKCLCLGISS